MKKIFLLLMALIAATTVWAEDYITDVMVIGGSKSETNTLKTTYANQGWTVIDQDLNAGASGDYIFLLYKKASETAGGTSFITDFYLSSASGTVSDNLEHNGRTYHLAACDGSDYFKSSKGDLNCHCSGSAYIHLYYTKEYPDNGQDYSTVKTISINNTQAGAVGENGGSTGYDLNAGAGGDYIYMHIVKSQGWTITNSAGTQCYINGFDGPKAAIASITIPTTLGGAQVAGFTGSVFSGFTNLETMIFNENTIISQMPSLQGCSKFKHVRTGTANDQTPPTMTNIPASAFAGTAIETINMPSVTNVGEHAFEGSAIETITMPSVTNIGEHAFEGCGLNQITLPSCLMEIGSYAFQNCNSLTDIYFDGTQQQWNNVTKGANWKPAATTEHWHCTVTFDVNGHGTAPASQNIEWSNQDKATEPTAPTVFGFTFNGWYTEAACTNQWDFNTVVTGDMTLYAKWEEAQYGFNSETGELTLNWGEFNKYNKWGDDVPAESVKSVTATSQVSFIGDCTGLFENFKYCTSMDLHSINTSNATDMEFMFMVCNSLTSLDLSGWDTRNVTNMSGMFISCGNLSSLNLSGWNTSNVTSMTSMFSGCGNLTSLDLSGWYTFNVTDMSSMFSSCGNLTSLDISSFNTRSVIFMDHMFANCRDLTAIDLSGFNTANVTDMSTMFYHCDCLTTIYIGSRWSTEKVQFSNDMFNGCNSLVGGMGTSYDENHVDKEYARIDGGPDCPGYLTKSPIYSRYTYNSETGELMLLWGEFNKRNKWDSYDVPAQSVKSVTANSGVSFTGDCSQLFQSFSNCTSMDLHNINTSNVTDMSNMFLGCNRLTSLDLSDWGTGNVTNMKDMFRDCYRLTSLDLLGWNTSNVTDMSAMFRDCYRLTSLDLSGWDTGNATRMESMFQDCNSLNSLDLSGWDTGNVTHMGEMFANCMNLSSLNLSGWNTSNVTSMTSMFSGCGNLTSLDLWSFNTGNVTDMYSMFTNCMLLSTIYASEMWSTENVHFSNYMFNGCNSLVGGMGTSYDEDHVDKEYARIDGGPDCPGYFTKSSISRYTYNSETGELKLLWGEFNKDNKWGDDVPAQSVKSVTATSLVSFIGDCSNMFYYFSNCESMDLSKVNTSNVTNMCSMFRDCNSLTSLDLSGWDTGNVIDMSSMFGYCSNLTSLNLTGWNTGNVTDMRYMFLNCSSLTTIYANSEWSTENVTNSDYMFNGCNSLMGGKGTSYDEDHIDKEYARIDGGPDCPGYFTNIDSRYTYNSKTGELKLNWGEFNKYNKWGDEVPAGSVKSVTATSDVSFTGDCSTMFYFFSNCESMDLSNVSTSNVTNMRSMFSFCQNLSMLDLTGWDTGNVTDMRSMFLNCNSLTSLDLSDWDTGNVTDMASMFIHCWNLSSLNLSGWDTGNVTDMAGMFANCMLLSTIYASEMWSTESVVESHDMFYNCRPLVGGKGTTYDSSHIDAEYARIDGGPESPGYFTDTNPVVVPGDVNGDGSVTSADVTALYNYLLNGDESYLSTSDVDGDGSITSADVTAVYSIILGNKK